MDIKLTWNLSLEDPLFLTLEVDGEEWKTVYKGVFIRHLSSLASSSTWEELKEKFEILERKLCKTEVLRLLSLKGRFIKELREKLLLKKFSEEALAYALAEAERLGFLNQEEETERFARKLQRKGYGEALIALKMRAKGASYEPHLAGDPLPQLRVLLAKKLRQTTKEKAIGFFLRRGFDYATILDALNSSDSL